MSISRIKQIKRILKDQDVRDPRGALQAIEQVLAQPKAEPGPKPLLTLTLTQTSPKTLCAKVKFDGPNLLPSHVLTAIESLNQFGEEKFGGEECSDPDCPVHGNAKPVIKTLSELIEQFKAETTNATKKGNLQ